jgi:hypothetical protein
MYGNCIYWALKQKITVGGYLKVQKTPKYWYIPRMSWSSDKVVWHGFVPLVPVRTPSFLQNLVPIHTFWFKGRVVRRITNAS